MDWQRLRQRILFPWGYFFWSASLVAVACRWRLLDRDPQLDTAPLGLLYVSSVDLAVHGIVGFSLAWLGDRWIRGVAKSVLFGLTFVGILFLIRMGYPLTPDLLRQVGGLMETQTSIAGAAGYRTWLLAAAVLGSFWACLALDLRYDRMGEFFNAQGSQPPGTADMPRRPATRASVGASTIERCSPRLMPGSTSETRTGSRTRGRPSTGPSVTASRISRST